MTRQRNLVKELTDEEVLNEFVARFQCDGAVLIYLDSNAEFGFGRWRNSKGRYWVKDLFKRFKQPLYLPTISFEVEGELRVDL